MSTTGNETNGGSITVNVDADLEDIIPLFLRNRQDDLAVIAESGERSDFDAIRIIGHKLKGLAGGYGFDGITDIGVGLERAAKEHDLESIRKLTGELASYLERVVVVYE